MPKKLPTPLLNKAQAAALPEAPAAAAPARPHVEAADAAALAKTPVTLGVVLLCGGVLASGIGAVYLSVQEISKTLGEFRLDTKDRLARIEEQLKFIGHADPLTPKGSPSAPVSSPKPQ